MSWPFISDALLVVCRSPYAAAATAAIAIVRLIAETMDTNALADVQDSAMLGPRKRKPITVIACAFIENRSECR